METFHSRRAPAYATHGMVASSQPVATQIGLQTLKEGGNAVDAAIAIAAILNITEPMMNGLGGDAFVMVFWHGKLHGLNASGRAGQAMTAEALRKGAGSKCLRLAGEASRYPAPPTAILRYTNASDRKDSRTWWNPRPATPKRVSLSARKPLNSGDGAHRNYDSRESRWNNTSLAGSHQNR